MPFFRSFGRNWFDFGKHGQTFHLGQDSLSGNERNCLFRNDGMKFTEVAWVAGAASKRDGRAFVPADFDRDGDLDFVVSNDGQEFEYFENRHPTPGHWVTLQLRSHGANAYAIGARIDLDSWIGRQTREIQAGAGFLSTPPPEAHFGLRDAEEIHAVTIRWPSGQVQVVEGLEIDRVHVIHQPGVSRPDAMPGDPAPTSARTVDAPKDDRP